MAESKAFVLWFLENLPSFFLAHPMSEFIGFVFLGFAISLFKRIVNL